MSQSNVEDRHLLLVDDDESLLRLMAIRLKGEG
jgi:two-component system response regulator GlrR